MEYLVDDPVIPLLLAGIEKFEEKFSESPESFNDDFFVYSAAAGRVDILRAVKKINPGLKLDTIGIVSAAVIREDREILKWIRILEEGERDPGDNPVVYATMLGKPELAMWLLEIGFEWDPQAASCAATSGCLGIIEVTPSLFLFLIPCLRLQGPSWLPPRRPYAPPPLLLSAPSPLLPSAPPPLPQMTWSSMLWPMTFQ
jgi:hypothetical protein